MQNYLGKKSTWLVFYKRAVALLLCLCLLTPGVSLATPGMGSINHILPELSSRIGHVDEVWQGPTGKTVYLIRDAHDSVAAQQNIAELIGYLVQAQGVKTDRKSTRLNSSH